MMEAAKPAGPGRVIGRSAWRLGVVGVFGVVGCRTMDESRQPSPGPPAAVSVYPQSGPAPAKQGRADSDVRPASAVLPALPPAQQPAPEALIDLGIALRLAGVENPTINLARESIREAQAEQKAAQALLLPTVNVGGNFNLHRGVLQQSSGNILDVNRQSLYLGGGAQAVGTGTVAFPGVRLFAHLGDAAYEPLAARQRVTARRADAHAIQNDILLDVAAAYLELVGAEERVRLLRHGEADLGEVVRLTAAYAKAGQGRSADANRAAANAQLLARETQVAEEERAVAVARLARLLNLDPAVRLQTPAGIVALAGVGKDAAFVLLARSGGPAGSVKVAIRLAPWEAPARYENYGLDQNRDFVKLAQGRAADWEVTIKLPSPGICLVKLIPDVK